MSGDNDIFKKINNTTNDLLDIITLSPVQYLTAEYSTFKTFEKTIITINLDPPQTSKTIYRKLKYREKVLGEFRRLPCFPRVMLLYSSTKFRIFKP